MIGIRVRLLFLACPEVAFLTIFDIQELRDFVLHLLANDKAQSWLYVKVRPFFLFYLRPLF